MAVFVFSTGSILKRGDRDAQLHISVNNRTVTEQSYRVIIWNTSAGVKTELESFADAIPANTTVQLDFTIPANPAVTRYEIEIRLSNPHMDPYIQQKYTSQLQDAEFKEAVYPSEMFQDSDLNSNP